MFRHLATIIPLALLVAVDAQQVGPEKAEVHPSLPIQKCTGSGTSATCSTVDTTIVLDANWRWLHSTDASTDGSFTNCFTDSWDTTLCPDGKTCAANCALEGADYAGTYGITTSGTALTLNFATGSNYGTRVYLLDNDNKYYMFKLKNQELTFDVNLSTVGCGLNAAVYLVEMDEDGGMTKYSGNQAGAKYGTGYCDAQCAKVKFINGEANTASDPAAQYGSCCTEVDILESNSQATAYTLHPCSVDGQYRCSGAECGDSKCDLAGCDFNPYRTGNQSFFGTPSTIDTSKKFTIDTSKPFTVVTQFFTTDNTAGGALLEVRRLWIQDGVVIKNSNSTLPGLTGNSLTDAFCDAESTLFEHDNTFKTHGGMSATGDAMDDGMVLTLSLWLDDTAQMLWLDSNYPVGDPTTKPGVSRGPCPTDSGKREDVIREQSQATVTFSNIKIGDIDSTYTI